MSDQYVPALRHRFLEDMQIKGLQPRTQTMSLRAMRDFTRFPGHPPDSATPEELRAFQLDMKKRGVGAPTFNNRLTVPSFFHAATCPRPENEATHAVSACSQEDPGCAQRRGGCAHHRKRHRGLGCDTARPSALPAVAGYVPVRSRISKPAISTVIAC